MKPTEILADCDRYLLGVADALHQLSTQYRVGSGDRAALQKQTEDLLKIQTTLKQIHSSWTNQESTRRKNLMAAHEQYVAQVEAIEKQKKAAILKTTCKACGHYKWCHQKTQPNACGSNESTCECTEYVTREDKKTKE